jgi:hypothetical protein
LSILQSWQHCRNKCGLPLDPTTLRLNHSIDSLEQVVAKPLDVKIRVDVFDDALQALLVLRRSFQPALAKLRRPSCRRFLFIASLVYLYMFVFCCIFKMFVVCVFVFLSCICRSFCSSSCNPSKKRMYSFSETASRYRKHLTEHPPETNMRVRPSRKRIGNFPETMSHCWKRLMEHQPDAHT